MSNSSHNQATSATRGGMGSVSTPANSGGSGLFGNSSVGATHDPKPATSSSPTRSGSTGSGLFGNLTDVKRSTGLPGAGRKSSLSDQSAKPGILGQAWNNFVHGPSKS